MKITPEQELIMDVVINKRFEILNKYTRTIINPITGFQSRINLTIPYKDQVALQYLDYCYYKARLTELKEELDALLQYDEEDLTDGGRDRLNYVRHASAWVNEKMIEEKQKHSAMLC